MITQNLVFRIQKFLVILLLITITFSLVGCAKEEFKGDIIEKDDRYFLDFEFLNTTVNGALSLKKDDRVEAVIEIAKGDVDIFVKDESGKVVYQGNDAQTGSFVLEIKTTGTFSIIITGEKAEGSVHFKVL